MSTGFNKFFGNMIFLCVYNKRPTVNTAVLNTTFHTVMIKHHHHVIGPCLTYPAIYTSNAFLCINRLSL